MSRKVLWLWGALLLAAGGARAEPFRTVIMIDASSSMRKTDPQKLRKVAAELYVDLAREGDLVAVSQFEAAVKDVSGGFQKIAGPETRERLKAAIRAIGDDGEWTDFGAAFSAAGKAFGPALPLAGYEKRFLVFLTDGRCEPAPGEARYPRGDTAERERRCQEYVLSQAIPEMKDVEAEVIGLSRGAPREFLQEAARRTGGRAVITERAEDLPHHFAQIHAINAGARVAEPKGNDIAVDRLVSSLDVVVVTSRDGEMALRRPGGAEVKPQEHGVRLVRGERYRLFHVPRPASGAWSLQSAKRLAPGAAAVIQSFDLQLKLSVPETATAGQPFEIREALAAGAEGGMPEESFLARHRFVALARAGEITREIPMRAAPDGARVGQVLVEKPGSVEIWGRVEPGPDGALTRIAPNEKIPVLPPLTIAGTPFNLGELRAGATIEQQLDLSKSELTGEVTLEVMPEGVRVDIQPKRIVLKAGSKPFDLTFRVPVDARPGPMSGAVRLTPVTRPYSGSKQAARIPIEGLIVAPSFFAKHGGKVAIAALLGVAAFLFLRSRARASGGS